MKKTTAKANINIALCKYWGKADSVNVYPTTTSISFTLDKFYTITSIESQSNQQQHTIIINNQQANELDTLKVTRFLEHFTDNEKVCIRSTNFVPTKAGLASSASAYASIAKAANKYFDKNYSDERLAKITRFGSGSAARSIFSNFVKWVANTDNIEMIDAPMMDIGMFVLMIDEKSKKIASTQAMELSKNTSWIYDHWVERANKQAMDMEQAIINNDFHKVGEIAQDNAMSMHMTMMSSAPSILYFQPKTIEIMHRLLHLQQTSNQLYFTMDAGPNIKVLIEHKNKEKIYKQLKDICKGIDIIYSQPAKGAIIIE